MTTTRTVPEADWLWDDYARSRERALADRDTIVAHHSGEVTNVVKRLRASISDRVETGDLIQLGTLGLTSAVERFDRDRGVDFRAYAASRILGQIRDRLPKLDPGYKTPHPVPLNISEPSETPATPSPKADRLWANYTRSRSRALADRNALVVHYSGEVNNAVKRLRASISDRVETGDLIQLGTLGLINAVERFDRKQGVQFRTYATIRIVGDIKDGLRKADPLSRPERLAVNLVLDSERNLQFRLGRPPTEDEIAADVAALSVDQVRKAFADYGMAQVAYLDALGSADEIPFTPCGTQPSPQHPGDRHETNEVMQVLHGAIRTLRDRDQLILNLYYFEELTLAQIGEILDVTEPRVSQLHGRAKAHLCEALTNLGLTPDVIF